MGGTERQAALNGSDSANSGGGVYSGGDSGGGALP
jgi:hypothetical protein